jgi:hypothetical protein
VLRYTPRQVTTIKYDLPGDNDNTQPLYLYPGYEAGGFLRVTGATSVVSTGPLAGVVAKNRVTPQLLQSNNLVGVATGQLAINTTHPSHAFPYTVGGTTLWSQPLAPSSIPTSPFSLPAEVDTWANVDSVTLEQLTTINLADFRPVLVDYNGAFDNFGYIDTFAVFDPSGAGSDNVYLGPHVASYDVRFDRAPMIVESNGIDEPQVFANCDFEGGFNGGTTAGQSMAITGGILRSTTTEYAFNSGVTLDGDTIFDATSSQLPNGIGLGRVYIETGLTLTVEGGSSFLSGFYATPVLWGPGALAVNRNARLGYDAGLHTATSIFLLTGGITLNSAVGGLCANGATLVANAGFAITGPHLDAACAAGVGFNQDVLNFGGASIVGGL